MNIIGIALSVVFGIVIIYYAGEVSDARLDAIFSSINSYSYSSPYSYSSMFTDDTASELTSEAGWICLVFFLFYLALSLTNLMGVKTKTMKVLSIIGLSLGGIFLIWDFLAIGSDGGISFDEISGGYFFFLLYALAMSIIGLIHVGIHNRKMGMN